MILRIVVGMWVVLVLGSLCWGYALEWLDDVRRGSSGEPPI